MMPRAHQRSITSILNTFAAEEGFAEAPSFALLVQHAYDDLHGLASACLARTQSHASGRTLTATVLVHDALMEFARQRDKPDKSVDFFALASFFMTRLIRLHARHHRAQKRGGGNRPMNLADTPEPVVMPSRQHGGIDDVDHLARVLERFRTEHPVPAEVFTLSSICEIPQARVCEMLKFSESTYYRHSRFARAWLSAHLEEHDDAEQ